MMCYYSEDKCVLQTQFPGQLNIAVDKLEGKSLRQQAALYSNASIVIQTHGAALGKACALINYPVVCIDVVTTHAAIHDCTMAIVHPAC